MSSDNFLEILQNSLSNTKEYEANLTFLLSKIKDEFIICIKPVYLSKDKQLKTLSRN